LQWAMVVFSLIIVRKDRVAKPEAAAAAAPNHTTTTPTMLTAASRRAPLATLSGNHGQDSGRQDSEGNLTKFWTSRISVLNSIDTPSEPNFTQQWKSPLQWVSPLKGLVLQDQYDLLEQEHGLMMIENESLQTIAVHESRENAELKREAQRQAELKKMAQQDEIHDLKCKNYGLSKENEELKKQARSQRLTFQWQAKEEIEEAKGVFEEAKRVFEEAKRVFEDKKRVFEDEKRELEEKKRVFEDEKGAHQDNLNEEIQYLRAKLKEISECSSNGSSQEIGFEDGTSSVGSDSEEAVDSDSDDEDYIEFVKVVQTRSESRSGTK